MPEATAAGRLQVLFSDPQARTTVAGLPPALRAAHAAAAELSPARIIFGIEDPGFESRWVRQIESLNLPAACPNGTPVRSLLSPEDRLLVLSSDGFPADGALQRFVAAARRSGGPVRWLAGSRTVAAYYPKAADAVQDGAPAAQAARKALSEALAGYESEPNDWISAADPDAVRAAEGALYDGLRKPTDGYLARLDRRLSIFLSSLLLKTPVTPNAITTASLALGLLGACGIASGAYGWQLGGALLLWFCCILDGCDGEIARLKLLCSPSGAAYDVAADHVAHLATFVAVPFGVHRAHPQAAILLPGLLLVSGFLACGASVWWLVLRRPETERGRYSLWIERVASRDYVYVILAFVALGRLDWFLWAAAFGSHLFNASLWWLSRRA